MQYFGQDEWLKKIGEDEDSNTASKSHQEMNNSQDDSELDYIKLSSSTDSHDDSESDYPSTCSA